MTTGHDTYELRVVSAQEERLRALHGATDRVLKSAPEGVVIEMPLHFVEVMTVFSRVRSHFMAIRMLVEHGLLEEAMSLWRGLFTDALRLAYLADEPDDIREGVFLNRQRESWRTLRSKFGAERVELGLDGLNPEEIARIDEQLRKIKARARRLNAPIDRGYPSDRELAGRFEQLEDYWVQRFASDAVHGSQLSLRRRMSKRGDFTAVASRTFDADDMSAVGILAMKAALRSYVSTARLCGWDTTAGTEQLQKVLAFETELDDRDKASSS